MRLIRVAFITIIAVIEMFAGCGNQGGNEVQTRNSWDDSRSWEPAAGLLRNENKNLIMKKVTVENTETIEIEYKVPKPAFEIASEQSYNGENTKKCKLGNAWIRADPGEPLTPYISSRIAIPYGRTIETIEVVPLEEATISGEHLLGFGEIPHPLSAERVIRAQANSNIYESDEPYPAYDQELFGVQDRCGVTIAIINVYPLHYYPAQRKVKYYKSFRLRIETKEIVGKESVYSNKYKNSIRVRTDRYQNNIMTEENPGTLDTYQNNRLEGATYSPLEGAKEENKYVIVTNQSIINANTNPNINDFIAHKEALGFTCEVKDIAEIYSQYSGSQNSDKLRNFLRDAYNNWNTEYVLLGGDTNIIPLKTVYEGGEYLPTDLPYQCLSQNTWNNDFEAEVYIGRASAENATEFSNFVYKTIAYETTDSNDSYFKNVLNLGEKLDSNTYSKPAMKAIENSFPSNFSFDGLYDQSGTWKSSQITSKVNTNQFSIINHLGHSNTHYVMKLNSSTGFNNTKFIFAKSQGCIPGAFDKDCIGEEMTTSNRKGMWAVVFNSRYGWYAPGNVVNGSSQVVHMSFWDAYFKQNLKRVGQCNEYSHRVNVNKRWDILDSNLLGDPSVIISGGGSGPNNPTPTPTSTPTPPSGDSCTRQSGGTYCDEKSPDGCWCDDLCTSYNDCCPDYQGICVNPTPTPTPTPTPPPGDSCTRQSGGTYCGSKSSDGCWCDDLCTSYNDCCPDYQEVC